MYEWIVAKMTFNGREWKDHPSALRRNLAAAVSPRLKASDTLGTRSLPDAPVLVQEY
jgi:hypothetical protein